MKLLLVALSAFALACGGTFVPREPTPARTDPAASTMTSARPVTGWTIWASRDQVPREYLGAVDWYTWTGQVLAVFSYRYVCAFVNDVGAPHVTRGEMLDCTWYAPRGE